MTTEPSAPSPTLRCPTPEATLDLGARLGKLLRGGDVIALSGELGAGKTTLVKGIARGLALDVRVPVTSPTFTLVNEYPSPIPLRHADFYRIESEQRLFELGFDDLFDGRGVVVVEWAERWPDALPRDRLAIAITLAGEPAAPRGGALEVEGEHAGGRAGATRESPAVPLADPDPSEPFAPARLLRVDAIGRRPTEVLHALGGG